MKKLMLLLSIATLLAMPMTDASAQSHRHTPRTTSNVTVNKNGAKINATVDNDTINGVVAFSDTTSAAAQDQDSMDEEYTYQYSSDNDIHELKEVMNALGPSLFMPIILVAIIFVVAPVIIILIICFFIYKNRQQKLKLAEMAMKNGQPIPDSVLGYSTKKQGANNSPNHGSSQNTESSQNTGYSANSGYSANKASSANGIIASMPTEDPLWRKGIMHFFIGLGLMLLLDSIMGDFGFSIGVLVTLYGAGQAFIAWTSNRNTIGKGNVDDAGNTANEAHKTEEEPAKKDTTDDMEIYPDDSNK